MLNGVQQFGYLDRFLEVALCAGGQTTIPEFTRFSPGNDEYGSAIGPGSAHALEPAHDQKPIPGVATLEDVGRKENIEQDEVRLFLKHDREGCGTVNGGKHLVAAGFEGRRQDVQDYLIVINNQNFFGGKT